MGLKSKCQIILNANRLTVLIKRQRSSDLIKTYEEKRKETSTNSQATRTILFFKSSVLEEDSLKNRDFSFYELNQQW